MTENRIHQEVFHGRVHPNLSGFTEKEIWTPRGEGLIACWELVNCGGKCSDVVSFLKVQTERLNARVTAILRARVSTWIVDVTHDDVRITHFRAYVPRSGNVRIAMLKVWQRRKEAL
jgi:hypothetical protein